MPDSPLPDFSLRASFPSHDERKEFFRAVSRGEIDKVRRVLDEKPDAVGWRCPGGLNDGAQPLLLTVHDKTNEMAELLLSRGADVNAADKDGWTALMWTVFAGNADKAEFFIRHGAEVEKANKWEETPLMQAAKRDHWDCADLLVICGADMERKNSLGKSAVDIAAAEGRQEVLVLDVMRAAKRRLEEARTARKAQGHEPVTGADILVKGPMQLKRDKDGWRIEEQPEAAPVPAPAAKQNKPLWKKIFRL
jgi:hypothetical protein